MVNFQLQVAGKETPLCTKKEKIIPGAKVPVLLLQKSWKHSSPVQFIWKVCRRGFVGHFNNLQREWSGTTIFKKKRHPIQQFAKKRHPIQHFAKKRHPIQQFAKKFSSTSIWKKYDMVKQHDLLGDGKGQYSLLFVVSIMIVVVSSSFGIQSYCQFYFNSFKR